MANEKVKLIKDFLTNQDANNTIDRSFSELISKKLDVVEKVLVGYLSLTCILKRASSF